MGRLRSCCLVLIFASVAAILSMRAGGAPAVAGAALLVGMALLAVVIPFPAHDRPARTRVFAACVAYAVASALAFLIALSSSRTMSSAATLVLPLAGSALALWAYRTRNRKRLTGFERYFRGQAD